MSIKQPDRRVKTTTPEEEGLDLHPDSWERFEQTVDKVVKGPPPHRAAPQKDSCRESPEARRSRLLQIERLGRFGFGLLTSSLVSEPLADCALGYLLGALEIADT
jgi:hypothetical protein